MEGLKIYHDDTVYDGWIDFRFILVHKGIFGNYIMLHRG